jgi:hypothetical protein
MCQWVRLPICVQMQLCENESVYGNANVQKCQIKLKKELLLAPGVDLAPGTPG